MGKSPEVKEEFKISVDILSPLTANLLPEKK